MNKHYTWQEIAALYNKAQELKLYDYMTYEEKRQELMQWAEIVLAGTSLIGGVAGAAASGLGFLFAIATGSETTIPYPENLPMTLRNVNDNTLKQIYVHTAQKAAGDQKIDMKTANYWLVKDANGELCGIMDTQKHVLMFPWKPSCKIDQNMNSELPDANEEEQLLQLTKGWIPSEFPLPSEVWEENIDQDIRLNETKTGNNTEQKSYIDDGLYHPDELDHTPCPDGTDKTPAQIAGFEDPENLDFSQEFPLTEESVSCDKSPWSDRTFIEQSNETTSLKETQKNLSSSQLTFPESFEPFPENNQCNVDEPEDPDVSDGFDPDDLPFE